MLAGAIERPTGGQQGADMSVCWPCRLLALGAYLFSALLALWPRSSLALLKRRVKQLQRLVGDEGVGCANPLITEMKIHNTEYTTRESDGSNGDHDTTQYG